ncbi:MAG: NADH-quinone oxidoreductase subunit J [Anaerolineae bacterium]|nr:NADH-quinone oxidoreductase subunit J [Anaerolineae bacterium]
MEAIFVIVSVIAVAAAVAMLLSENAVHSALFLIVNFACVAFLYLMLDAPFLAMVQIAVYAGAIMVLFLFVIMLLGAEKLVAPGDTRQFRWLAPLALLLGAAFTLIIYVYISQGQIRLIEPSGPTPMVRVVHAAPYAGPVDIYVDGERVVTGVNFSQASSFMEVPVGDHTVTVNIAETSTALVSAVVTLPEDNTRQANTFTVVAYGGSPSAPPAVTLIPDNMETVPQRSARVTVFNAYTEPINLIDFGLAGDAADDRLLTGDLAVGTSVELAPVAEDQSLRAWTFTGVNAAQSDLALLPELSQLDNPVVYSVERDTAQLMVLAAEPVLDGGLRAVVIPLTHESVSSFGGPHAVGELLFTRYMLPFQLIAVLLLAAMIGAIVLTHKEDFQPRRRDIRRKVMKPLSSVISDQVGQDVTAPQDDTPRLPEKQPEAVGD